jgi:cytoplasmic iron level regulating protein YaaA (DUF328/UPF0246 family)
MLILLSPSKTMDFSIPTQGDFTTPDFLKSSEELIKTLRKAKLEEISQLMSLSQKLTQLNYERYKKFSTPFTVDNARQAAYAFKGDVYDGLQFDKFNERQVAYAQEHLRMLSGLYGVLRPLDLIQPYRLEMGTRLKNKKGKDLYSFWGDKITEKLNDNLESQADKTVINLASNEYFKAVNPKLLNTKIITPEFKEYKNGAYKMIMLYAKQARGMMAGYIIKNQIAEAVDILNFNESGYKFSPELSKENNPVFVR